MDSRATIGCLVGAAVGDAIGLPYEGLSPRRAARLFPGPLRHRLLPGRGMVSDDTEHACFTARALVLAGGDVDAFGRILASSLRWWLAGLPAGVGLATLRALARSCVGFGPERSGVTSAGAGPAGLAAVPERSWLPTSLIAPSLACRCCRCSGRRRLRPPVGLRQGRRWPHRRTGQAASLKTPSPERCSGFRWPRPRERRARQRRLTRLPRPE